MSSKAPRASFKFKSNPKTIKYIAKNFEIVDRAIKHADIILPTSRLIPVDSQEYFEFKERSFFKLDNIIKEIDPTVSGSVSLKIIVETQISVDKLVAIRKQGNEADLERFKKTEALVKKIVSNLTSTIEILTEISKDASLAKTVMDTMNGFRKESDLYFGEMKELFEEVPFLVLEEIKDAKPLLFIMATLVRVNLPLLRLKDDLADSRLIRSAAEYRCASMLAWIWWEHLGRYPTLTRNDAGRAREAAPKTSFQSFVEEAVPRPGINAGVIRKVVDDLRFITHVGIAEKPARDLLLKARSNAKLSEMGVESARSLLLHVRSLLGERGRRNSEVRNPQA